MAHHCNHASPRILPCIDGSSHEAHVYYSPCIRHGAHAITSHDTSANAGLADAIVCVLQRENRFFPVWAYVIPTTVVRLPVSFVETLLWTVVTYFSVNLAPTAGRSANTAVLLCISPSAGLQQGHPCLTGL